MPIFFQWIVKFIDSQLFAAIIGALIGIIGVVLTFWLSIWHENRKKKQERCEAYTAWLNGLRAEIAHVIKCINEISEYVNTGNISTKRMNTDFIEKARLQLFCYDEDIDFLECVTNAYRDIVHTNDMLERLERMFFEGKAYQTILPNIKASMQGVNNSVNNLKSKVELKLKYGIGI